MRTAMILAASGAALVPASSASAQHQHMPGMTMPMPAEKTPAPSAAKTPMEKSATPRPKRTAPSREATASDQPRAARVAMDHGGMSAGSMQHTASPSMAAPAAGSPPMGDPHVGHDMVAMPGMATPSATLPAGDAPPPPTPHDRYADRFYPSGAMADAEAQMMREQGGQTFTMVSFNLAEYQFRQGHDGYRWDGEAWIGGDINRLTVKTEGEGAFGDGVESAEVQALYSRAVGPYFNLQAGLRHDFQPSPTRTYATVGFEGLAPYMFDVEGAAFLSDHGDLLGRLEGYYDQRITQRLILQPRVELNLAVQDVRETRIGAGLSNAELGLRLRYEITREFAPYVGISYDAKVGRTARYARDDGEDPTTTSLVAGIRFWF